MRINVTNLRAFHAVAQHGGFSAAAAELNVSQPALTRQVRDLENTYDIKLFNRSTRHVSLTPIGQILHRRLGRAFSELADIEFLLKNENRKELMTYSVSSPMLLTFMNAGHSALPSIKLNVDIMPSADVYRGLTEKRCDFGFLTMPEDNPDLDTLYLGSFPIVAVVGEAHALYGLEKLNLHHLIDQTIIIGPLRASTRWNFDQIADGFGVRPKALKVVESPDKCIYMARAGIGIGIIGGDGEFEATNPSARLFEEPEMQQRLHFACQPKENRSRAADLLYQLAKDVLPVKGPGN